MFCDVIPCAQHIQCQKIAPWTFSSVPVFGGLLQPKALDASWMEDAFLLIHLSCPRLALAAWVLLASRRQLKTSPVQVGRWHKAVMISLDSCFPKLPVGSLEKCCPEPVMGMWSGYSRPSPPWWAAWFAEQAVNASSRSAWRQGDPTCSPREVQNSRSNQSEVDTRNAESNIWKITDSPFSAFSSKADTLKRTFNFGEESSALSVLTVWTLPLYRTWRGNAEIWNKPFSLTRE